MTLDTGDEGRDTVVVGGMVGIRVIVSGWLVPSIITSEVAVVQRHEL